MLFGYGGQANHDVLTRGASWRNIVYKKDNSAEIIEAQRLQDAEELVNEQGGELIRFNVSR